MYISVVFNFECRPTEGYTGKIRLTKLLGGTELSEASKWHACIKTVCTSPSLVISRTDNTPSGPTQLREFGYPGWSADGVKVTILTIQ